MNYFIQRGPNEYGPYTLADLQRYVAQGSILMSDLTRSEGMADWVPVSQVIGNIPIPLSATAIAAAGGTVYGGGTGYSDSGAYGAAVASLPRPVPPDFHWALVLLIGVVTCGLFLSAWLIVEAAWIRKIKPSSSSLVIVIGAIAAGYVSGFLGGAWGRDPEYPIASVLWLGSVILHIVAVFSVRGELEEYYNATENINLRLSGVMTFFFAIFYFQHHFSRIAKWKKTGILEPQH